MDRVSASFNLVIAAVGCGVLSFPFGFAQCGLAVGFGCMICFAVFNAYTLDVLSRACLDYLSDRSYRNLASAPKSDPNLLSQHVKQTVTYEQLIGYHLGPRYQLLTELSIGLGTTGALVGFLVVISTLASQAFGTWFGTDSIYANRAVLTFTFALCIALPLSSLPDMHALRFSSLLSILSVLAVVALIVIRALQCIFDHPNSYCPNGTLPSIEWIRESWTAIRVLPLCVFAFGCQVQAVPCFFELRPQFQNRASFAYIGAAVALVCGCIYAACGSFGYILFSTQVNGNILLSFSDHDQLAVAVKLAMAIHIVLACPVIIYPTRALLRRFLSHLCSVAPPSGPINTADTSLLQPLSDNAAPATSHTLSNFAQAAGVCVLASCLAVVAPQVQVVFGLIGATAGISLTALLPGLLLLYQPEQGSKIGAWSIIVFSGMVGVAGTVLAVLDL
jgi:amino acid permease